MAFLFNKKKKQTGTAVDSNGHSTRYKVRKVANTIMFLIVFFGLLGAFSGVSVIKIILDKSDIVLNAEDLESTEVSIVYDDAGNEIAHLGKEDRVNVSYNDIPQVVIDAFLSVEDSRYFEHPGFDLPRFTKAFIENIKSLDFSQGGSTITMQVIKNTYFSNPEASITRKVQEIYYSLQITNIVSKQKIMEMYINKINYGGTTRGLQVASQYYFGKDCTDLSLVEAATLAGIVNAPNGYNPYYHLKACTERRDQVLDLMVYHGYITQQECDLAKKIDIADLLTGTSSTSSNNTETTVSNLAYVDVVVNELNDMGIDPYTTPVRVYTAMNQTVQDYCDDVANGKVLKFKDDYINTAFSVIQNNTGLVVGICGGRGYNQQRMFNYATDSSIRPGSTSKAVLTYPLAFEYCGLSTSYVFTDAPTYWTGSSVQIFNDSAKYYGQVSLERAFCQSYNIPSVLLYRWIVQTVGTEKIQEYMTAMGFYDSTVQNLNEQYAIGGQDFLVSPMQMAAAESAILSGGKYTEPHCITRVEYINSTADPIVNNKSSTQAVSAGAAWLDSYIQSVNVSSNSSASDFISYNRLTYLKRSSYTVYGKTGTASYDTSIRNKYGIPFNGAKDIWIIAGDNDYSTAVWIGYDSSKYMSKSTYITYKERMSHWDSLITRGVFDALEAAYGKPKNTNSRPSSVGTITHVLGTYPYKSLPAWGNTKYQTTGYILSQYAAVEEWETPTMEYNPSSVTVDSISSTSITCTMTTYPDTTKTTIPSDKMVIKSKSKTYNGNRLYDQLWIDGTIVYNFIVRNGAGTVIASVSSTTPQATLTFATQSPNSSISVEAYYGYAFATDVRSISVSSSGTTPDATYTVTVNSGTASPSGAQHSGTFITVTADTIEGQNFTGWTASGITLSDPTSQTISFNMPANNVTLTAEYSPVAP